MENKGDDIVKAISKLGAKFDAMKASFDKLLAELNLRVSTCEKDIKSISHTAAKQAKLIDKISDDNRVLQETLEEERKQAKTRIQAAEKVSDDIIEATQRLRSLRVDLLPEVPGEHLKTTVAKLFSIVGRRLEDNTICYRLKMGRSNGTVILTFATEGEKEAFFSDYIKIAKDLLVSKFVSDPEHKESRVYISHDLCQTQYQIWKALSKVPEGIIKRQRLHRGFVYISTAADKPPQRILSMEMLKCVTG